MAKYNDLDMSKWKEYNDIETNSLWIIEKRDNSGAHNGYYHGNFIPQIPRQLFSRYTKEGDWILDPFCGSGTSLIEAQRMKRNSIGIEIQYDVAKDAYRRVISEKKAGVTAKILVGDSKSKSVADRLSANGIDKVQFIIFHPPYWNIIKFSEDKNDLSNCENLNSFLDAFREAVINTTNLLEKNRYCAVVMGDKYENGQVIPLGFYCMNQMIEMNFLLKAILVKNFGKTKGKSNRQGIWRYRALANDFYIFQHEYIFVFKKLKNH